MRAYRTPSCDDQVRVCENLYWLAIFAPGEAMRSTQAVSSKAMCSVAESLALAPASVHSAIRNQANRLRQGQKYTVHIKRKARARACVQQKTDTTERERQANQHYEGDRLKQRGRGKQSSQVSKYATTFHSTRQQNLSSSKNNPLYFITQY